MKQREFIFPAIAKFGIGFVACLTRANKIQISTQTRNHNGIIKKIRRIRYAKKKKYRYAEILWRRC